jgi:hypothetical protein
VQLGSRGSGSLKLHVPEPTGGRRPGSALGSMVEDVAWTQSYDVEAVLANSHV